MESGKKVRQSEREERCAYLEEHPNGITQDELIETANKFAAVSRPNEPRLQEAAQSPSTS